MASYTEHYGLHQWEPEDPFLRTDFNADLEKIDTVLYEKSGVVTGTYAGNNAASQSINLGFHPQAVLVMENTSLAGTSGGSYPMAYGGLALQEKPVEVAKTVALQISDTGFTVYNYPDFDYIRINRTDKTYYYLAVK